MSLIWMNKIFKCASYSTSILHLKKGNVYLIQQSNSSFYFSNFSNVEDNLFLPYFTCATSPTTISATGIWITCPPRTTVNFCSCSMRLWRPLNCFSLLQSLKAVTRTTQITDRRMAAPSIQPASDSFSSSTPPAALPQSAEGQGQMLIQKNHHDN